MHTLTSAQMQQLLGSAEAQRLSMPARQRLTWIAEFVQNGQSISETCSRFGIARSTFHRWLERFDPADLSSLEERAHDPYATRTPAVPAEIVELIRGYRKASPLMGKERIRELLKTEHNLDVSSSTIGRTIERECMYYGSTPLHWRKRAKHERTEPGVIARPTVTAAAQTQTAAPAAACDCAWCRLRAGKWTVFRRSLALTSLVANLAFISIFLATLLWEKQGQEVRADLMSTNHIQSSLDLSDDGR